MKTFFLSLRTTVWTLAAFIIVFFAGSYFMPAHRDIFGPMNETLLFTWLLDRAVPNPWQTWWFFLSLALLVLLTINTLVCSIEAVRRRWSRSEFLLRIAPQVVHAGFLCILLAHLLGAGWGYRLSGRVPEGAFVRIPGDRILQLRELQVVPDRFGNLRDWAASIALFEQDRRVASGTLGPNRPFFHRGTGIYLSSLDFERGPAAVLLVNRDPGALWALAGGVLFTVGSVLLLVLKWRMA